MTARDPATLLRLKPEDRAKLVEVSQALGMNLTDTVARLVRQEEKRLLRRENAKYWKMT
jgi:hypothetical protein